MIAIWFHTIFGFQFYHRLRAAGKWLTLFFALFLWLVGLVLTNLYFSFQIRQKLPLFLQKLPALTFEQGHLVEPKDKTRLSIPGTDYRLILDAAAAPETIPSPQDFVQKKLVAFVTRDMIYTPGVTGINAQPIPSQFHGTFNQAWFGKHMSDIRNVLQSIVLIGSVFAVAFFGICSVLLAGAVLYFWRGMLRAAVPTRLLWKWAVFLQGPALILWIIQLIWGIPLFVFGLFILFNIYIQQIFNTLPDSRGNHAA